MFGLGFLFDVGCRYGAIGVVLDHSCGVGFWSAFWGLRNNDFAGAIFSSWSITVFMWVGGGVDLSPWTISFRLVRFSGDSVIRGVRLCGSLGLVFFGPLWGLRFVRCNRRTLVAIGVVVLGVTNEGLIGRFLYAKCLYLLGESWIGAFRYALYFDGRVGVLCYALVGNSYPIEEMVTGEDQGVRSL